MEAVEIQKVLRRLREYSNEEVIAIVHSFCIQEQWPRKSVSEILIRFADSERQKLSSISNDLLSDMKPEHTGFHFGNLTPEDGDADRLMASPLITREFIEELSMIHAN